MAALIDNRELEVKDGDVDWKTIGAEATKTCSTLHRTIVLKSLSLSFDPSLTQLSMDERRQWRSRVATICGCSVHEFPYYGWMTGIPFVFRRI